MIGLSKTSRVKEIIENGVRYTVGEEKIDIEALNRERAGLQNQLTITEPDNSELIEAGKSTHPFYQVNRNSINNRITEIDRLLK